MLHVSISAHGFSACCILQGWVQSYGSRYVRPPIIHDDVVFHKPMTVREFAVAQQLTTKPVKGMLTGVACCVHGSSVECALSVCALSLVLPTLRVVLQSFSLQVLLLLQSAPLHTKLLRRCTTVSVSAGMSFAASQQQQPLVFPTTV